MLACDRLYRAPEGCFWYAGDAIDGESAPAIKIDELWTTDKSDIAFLQAECSWNEAGVRKSFPTSADAILEKTIGRMNCNFRPYPHKPQLLNPGNDPACGTRTPADGYDFPSAPNDVSIQVPYDRERCAGAWETIQVHRTSPDGNTRLELDVWLKTR